MVVRTLAFLVLRRVLGLVVAANPRTPRTWRSQCCVTNWGATPTDRPAPLHTGRPDDPGDPGEAITARALADLPGHPIDPGALAPGADPPTLDLPGQ